MERNVLVIKSANIETKFLTESELPLSARPQYVDETLMDNSETKAGLIFIYYYF